MPSISRRRLLGGAAAIAGGAYGVTRLYRGRRSAEFKGWKPEPGTWPLRRYDIANTAHNPHASPPREPPERRELTTEPSGAYFWPLVGSERVVLFGDELVEHAAGESTTLSETEARLAGVGPDDTLHAVHEPRADPALVGYDGSRERYRHAVPSHADWMTIGRSGMYVGTSRRDVYAFTPEGGREWSVDGTMTALANGRLYATPTHEGITSYREREPPERWYSVGPERAWSTDTIGGISNPPAVADGRLLVGSYGIRGASRFGAFDIETGEPLWEPKRIEEPDATDVSTPAVAGRAGYVAAGVEGLRSGFVARYDLETGDEIWRDDTDWYAYGPVLAGDTLVVAGDVRTGSEAPARKVRAYDTASGEELWTVTFDTEGGTSVTLAGERVLATAGDTLYELV